MKRYEIVNDLLVETEKQSERPMVCVCTPDELRRQAAGFAPRTADELERPGPAKLEAYEGYDFIVLNLITNPDRFETQKIGLYITSRAVYFVSVGPGAFVLGVLGAFQQTKVPGLRVSKVVYAFFNSLTTHDSEKLEALEEEISGLEERVLKGSSEDYIKDIVTMRKKLMFYKKYYEQLLDVAESMEENINGLLSADALRHFKMFTARVDRLNRHVINLRDYITQVREAYQSQVDIGLNTTMKLFTVITAIFLPLTLFVGWYGMNFKNMPELQWEHGYLYAIIFSAVILTVSLIYFKKKKMF